MKPAEPSGPNGADGAARALVVHPAFKSDGRTRSIEARLAEAVGLADAIALVVVDTVVAPISSARPSTLFGKGKVAELAERVAAHSADLVVVDAALTPVQQRNLERALAAKVIDRTGLILEIFGARAQTREGRLQVELAALDYQRSRLVRSWTHLERQRGGFGFLGGPGESQLETDRRLISERMHRIRLDLESVKRTRALHRRARRAVPYPVVALVGYTNAGKSTLFNRLTKSQVYADDKLFATLDPTMRALDLPGGRRVILSDTVGFVSALPTELVAAFRATLEEVLQADVILHVRDFADPERESQKEDVLAILADLGITPGAERLMIEVFNKIDLLDDERRRDVGGRAARNPRSVAVSAVTGEGIDALCATLAACLAETDQVVELALSHSDGAALAWLYDRARVLAREEDGDGVRLTVSLDPIELGRFRRRFGSETAP